MKIQSLKVRGAIGFKKGLGLDEINVDFSRLSGLVALAGPNGHGKTTLLENLSPYRMFASRTGSMRHHFFLRDSFRDLTFEYGGDLYRTLVKIDSDSDRTEGFIWKNGESQVDGKVTNYSRYIEDLLGTSNLFYNSVFCAQNSDKMSDMTTGDLKGLFVEFLRLDRLARYETTAKQCCNVLNGSALQLQRTLEGLQDRMNEFQGLENQLLQITTGKGALVDRMDDINKFIKAGRGEIEALKDTQAQNSVNIERRDDLGKDIQAHRDEMTKRYQDHLEEKDRIDQEINEKNKLQIRHRSTLRNKEAIIQAANKASALESELSYAKECDENLGRSLEKLYEKCQNKGNEIQTLRNEIGEIETNQSRKDVGLKAIQIHESMKATRVAIDNLARERTQEEQSFELVQIDSDIKACKETMALLDQRGECPVENPACSFVLSALKAKERLVKLDKDRQALLDCIEKKVADIDAKIAKCKVEYQQGYLSLEGVAWIYHNLKTKEDQATAELKAKISELEAEQEDLRGSVRDLQAQRKENRGAIDRIKSDLEQARTLAERLPEVQQAETQAQQLEKDIQTLESTIKDKRDQYQIDDIQARNKLGDLKKRLEDVKALIDEDAPKKLADARGKMSSYEREKDRLANDIKAEGERIAVLNQRLQEKGAVEKEIETAQAELGRITVESAQWLYVQLSCGKTGLQALEIDGVAPLITGYANDLLTSTFGPNFSVRLVTQDPETGKEILDIVVIRGDGSETHLENLSGGEKVWVLKSLRLAMTLVSKQKSERNFQTILCDEEDGPLDAEKAQSFVGLYKSILDVGGFDSCFYISHNPEVVGMADHRVSFSREGIRVE